MTERPLTGGLVYLLAGLAAIGALATNIILPSFPQMAADLGVSAKDLGLLLSSFFVAFAFGQLVVGPLSDRFGRAKLVIGGLAVFTAGSILCAVATTFPMMVTGRVIQAIGACTASVLARAIGRDLFEGAALGRALALTMIASAAAPGFSPLLGSLLVTLSHWRVTFVVVAAFSVALGIHYARRIGETHGADRRTPLAPVAVAKAYGHLLSDRRFLLPAVAVGVIIGGLYSFFAAAPSILMVELGLTALQLGLSFAFTVLIVFFAGFLAPRLADRWGGPAIALVGLLVAFIGGVAMFVFAASPTFATLTLAIMVFLFGVGLTNPLATAIALSPFGQQAGLASALLGFLQMAFAALGAFCASSLPFAPAVSLGIVLTAGAVIGLIAFVPVWLRGPKVTPRP